MNPPDALPGDPQIDLFWILILDLSQTPFFGVCVATFARKVPAWLQNGLQMEPQIPPKSIPSNTSPKNPPDPAQNPPDPAQNPPDPGQNPPDPVPNTLRQIAHNLLPNY